MNTLLLALGILVNGGVIKDDFLINPDPQAKCNKDQAFATSTANGWYVAWVDSRNAGLKKTDIYGQYLSSTLTPIGNNLMVNFDSTDCDESMVGAASDSVGNAIIMWKTLNGNMMDYHLRKVSPSGVLQVKDTVFMTLPSYCYGSLAMNSKGEYALAWQDADYIGIAFFNADGSSKAPQQQVSQDKSVIEKTIPRLAIASNGATIVTWYRNALESNDATSTIYARCYNPKCEPRGDAFKVVSHAGNGEGIQPRIFSLAVGTDHAGSFILSWVDFDESQGIYPYRLYFRSYGWDGSAHEPAKEIDKDVGWTHRMAVSWDASFCVAWTKHNEFSDDETFLQNFYADGSKRGPELTLCLGDITTIQDLTTLADEWLAVYSTGKNIYARHGMVQGSIIGSEMLLNDDEGSTDQVSPQVLAQDAGNFAVFWDESGNINDQTELIPHGRDSNAVQCFDRNGSPSGAGIVVNVGPAGMNPETGEFVKAWIESGYYMRRYTPTGKPSGDSILINTQEISSRYSKYVNVSMNRKGSVVALYSDGYKPRNLLARRFDKKNKPIDEEPIEVADGSAANYPFYIDVAMREDNGFVTAFLVQDENSSSPGYVYLQGFDKDGVTLSEPVVVSENPELLPKLRPPSIAMDTSGNYCVAWCAGPDLDDFTVYAQCFDASGQKLGANLNTGVKTGSLYGVGIAAKPSGGYVVFATDYSSGNPDVSAFYINNNGTVMGRKVQINEPDFFQANYQRTGSNSVAATDDRIFYTWLDNRRHKGWDVFAKIMNWDVPGVEEPSSPVTPVTPVTPVSHLLYIESGIGSAITLSYSGWPEGFRASVFDASGRKVDEIITTDDSGILTWESHQCTGVYFIVARNKIETAAKVVILR